MRGRHKYDLIKSASRRDDPEKSHTVAAGDRRPASWAWTRSTRSVAGRSRDFDGAPTRHLVNLRLTALCITTALSRVIFREYVLLPRANNSPTLCVVSCCYRRSVRFSLSLYEESSLFTFVVHEILSPPPDEGGGGLIASAKIHRATAMRNRRRYPMMRVQYVENNLGIGRKQ